MITSILRQLADKQYDSANLLASSVRRISASASSCHVHAVAADESHVPTQNNGALPRWKRDLGAIRTDWT